MILNKIYFGDNLDILKKYIKDESVDLIYLDPPFNSKKAYNIIYEKDVQIKAFDDTWSWTGDIPKTYDDLLHSNNPQVIEAIKSFRSMLGENNMMAYLTMMTPRLMELHRVLKDTGSIYLHCDPTASHYLKIIMDNIFGIKNFRNEIVWCYSGGGGSKKHFGKKHDIIFFYTKTNKYNFNCDSIRIPYTEGGGTSNALKKGYIMKKNIGSNTHNWKPNDKGKVPEDYWHIPFINPMSKERTGYPTQKPLALLERIIKASSNKGDIVLDPFCGCATTMIASEQLDRQWIGIDITYQSVRLLKERLRENKIHSTTFSIEGEPNSIEQVYSLIKERGRFRFQDWITGKVGGVPNTKKTGDKGEDGYYYWVDNKKSKKAIISVKSGHVTPSDIRDLIGTIDGKADAGVFLTLEEPTPGMISKTNSKLFIEDSMGGRYPKIQILTVKEILNGKKIDLPRRS